MLEVFKSSQYNLLAGYYLKGMSTLIISSIGALSAERRPIFIALVFQERLFRNIQIGQWPLQICRSNCENMWLNVVFDSFKI